MLVAGGTGEDDVRFVRMDPDTGRWAPTAAHEARSHHTATLLDDGRVFLAGGDAEPTIGTWAIFDPSTGTISASGRLQVARWDHTAVRLRDGKVLLVGGNASPTAELFDPATGRSWLTGTMTAGSLHEEPAVLLEDGRVLAAGGWNETPGDGYGALCELFDPSTETWERTGSLNEGRQGHALTPLPDGGVLVFGGHRPPHSVEEPLAPTESSERYDPVTGTWSSSAPLQLGRFWIRDQAVALPSGRILVAGGNITTDLAGVFVGTARTELYDPITGRWEESDQMDTARVMHTVSVTAGGRVVAVGGSASTWTASYWTEPIP